MTKKISISLPDDVAEHLEAMGNVSAYITEAIIQRRRSEATRAMMRRHGHEITEQGVTRWRRRLAARQHHSDIDEQGKAA